MEDVLKYFREAIKRGASDLHLVADSKPAIRLEGGLIRIGERPIIHEEFMEQVKKLITKEQLESLMKEKELDMSLKVGDQHFRVNFHFQKRKLGMAARVMPKSPPGPEEIGFDETLYGLTHLNDGLVLVTGPAGSGKSTTLATMLNIINLERRSHIITIEDPIEYHFENIQSIVEQRELNFDTHSFASALKHSLRQDPNVIMVGEMRDQETITTALQAAETGHLVFSTLHTSTALETVSRIVDMFPASSHKRILNQLSSCLRAVISQQLLPRKKGGLVVAREIMINNPAISNLIRADKLEQIYSAIETGSQDGMITMNKAIESLYEKDVISEKTAESKKRENSSSSTYY